MVSYEELTQQTPIIFDDHSELPPNLKGIYVATSFTQMILLNKTIDTITERKCVLAEELGHYYTTYGDIIDQHHIENCKHELRARQWGYKRLVPLSSFIEAYNYGVRNRFEFADYLDVTEEFLQAAINRYEQIYGECTFIDNYIIRFNPFGIAEMFK